MALINKGKGRPKGSQNKITKTAREIADRMGVCPMEILLHFANKDWKALGYESPTLLKITADGAHEVDRISAELRASCAKEAAKYIYPTQKAVEITTDDNSIRVVIEDYKTAK